MQSEKQIMERMRTLKIIEREWRNKAKKELKKGDTTGYNVHTDLANSCLSNIKVLKWVLEQ